MGEGRTDTEQWVHGTCETAQEQGGYEYHVLHPCSCRRNEHVSSLWLCTGFCEWDLWVCLGIGGFFLITRAFHCRINPLEKKKCG